MGLLDWLTDIGGQSASIGSAPPNSGMPGQPPQTMPPAQQVGADGPPLQSPPAPPSFPINGTSPIQSSPPVMPAQAPRQDQPIAPVAPPSQTAPAPPVAPPVQTASPTSLPPPMAPSSPPNPGPGHGFLGQAFGMSSQDEKNTLGGLGAGLKSVGENWNKPGLAAFSGSAGSAIEGAAKTDNENIDRKLKEIAIKQKAGDDSSATSLAKVKLQTAQLQLENLKAGQGKGTAWNKPPQQLYQDAMRLAASDPDVKASQKALEQAIKDAKSPADPALIKAQQDHAALVAAVQDKHLHGVGLPPQSAAAVAKQPGLTDQNPVPQSAFNGKPFEQVMKPQPYDQYFVDEKGQTRVLKATKKGEAAKAPPATQASVPTSPADAADEDE